MADRPPTFNELLIKEVQNHPELYDQQHRVCTDNEERNLMWEVIARKIDDNVTGEFAKKRWLQMRDRYRKELKMALRNMTQPKWPYFEKLSWLDPYLKDSKSAGLIHPSVLSGFDLSDNSPLLEQFQQMKELKNAPFWNHSSINDQNEVPEFPYVGNNASALLENIMAASTSAFEQLQMQRQREEYEFSPDSAVASTSEDGEQHIKEQSSSTAGSEAGSSTSNHRPQSASPEHDSNVKLDETSNSESGHSIENSALDPSLLSMPGLTNPDGSLSFMGNVIRNLSASVSLPQQNRSISRNRNPPYLVRRGGGIKIKQERVQDSAFSAFKPLAKTMSVGGLSQLNMGNVNTNIADRENLNLDERGEWTTDEDVLFARLVAVRLKKFAAKDKRLIRARISEFLDEKEDQVEFNKVRA